MSINGYGNVLANSWGPPPRRKTEAELRRMDHVDRLLYEANHPLTDAEKQAQLEDEDMRHRLGLTGEFTNWSDRDIPPPDWGT